MDHHEARSASGGHGPILLGKSEAGVSAGETFIWIWCHSLPPAMLLRPGTSPSALQGVGSGARSR
jgi:hypothetical protein